LGTSIPHSPTPGQSSMKRSPRREARSPGLYALEPPAHAPPHPLFAPHFHQVAALNTALPVRVVLLRPHDAENLGAAARALNNFGLNDWVWVDPVVDDLERARRVAVHSTDVLSSARVASSLDAAVADCVWVVGTTSRRVPGKRRVNPRTAA